MSAAKPQPPHDRRLPPGPPRHRPPDRRPDRSHPTRTGRRQGIRTPGARGAQRWPVALGPLARPSPPVGHPQQGEDPGQRPSNATLLSAPAKRSAGSPWPPIPPLARGRPVVGEGSGRPARPISSPPILARVAAEVSLRRKLRVPVGGWYIMKVRLRSGRELEFAVGDGRRLIEALSVNVPTGVVVC